MTLLAGKKQFVGRRLVESEYLIFDRIEVQVEQSDDDRSVLHRPTDRVNKVQPNADSV